MFSVESYYRIEKLSDELSLRELLQGYMSSTESTDLFAEEIIAFALSTLHVPSNESQRKTEWFGVAAISDRA